MIFDLNEMEYRYFKELLIGDKDSDLEKLRQDAIKGYKFQEDSCESFDFVKKITEVKSLAEGDILIKYQN